MTAEQHPLFQAWREALDHMIEAERRYYTAVMQGKPEGELQPIARELDEARERYHEIAARVG